MQQLSGLDTLFLNIETGATYGHVSGLALFDPATTSGPTDFDSLKALIDARIHLVPPYRRRLVEVPFGLDQPYWIEDPDFDLDFHVRHIGLPAPGDTRQLAAQVERIVSRPLDRRRPLWELYMIEGLDSGYIAQLSKIHHCAIDGVTGAEILASLLDASPEGRDVEPPVKAWRPDREPSDVEMLRRGLLSVALSPVKGARLGAKALSSLPAITRSAFEMPALAQLKTLGGRPTDALLSEASTRPPRTSFNTRIGPHRHFGFTSIPLSDVKTVRRAYDVTINDVVMAMCAGALRGYLDGRGELPVDPLIAMVPISVRTDEAAGMVGNQVAGMTASLHTHVPDPIGRLESIHASMLIAKETHEAIPAALLQDVAQFSPPAVTARAARVVTRASARNWVDLPYNIVISNVPGPQFPLYGGGARLVANYPISAIHDGVGLNITVQSYDGNLDVGVVGCRDLVPDVWNIVDRLRAATDELKEHAQKRLAEQQTVEARS
jgi:WS/DGAT/MGAT family acyltransferase